MTTTSEFQERVKSAVDWLTREIEKCNYLSEGPWEVHPDSVDGLLVWNGAVSVSIVCGNPYNEKCKANAAFIARSKTFTPEVLKGLKVAVETLAGIWQDSLMYGACCNKALEDILLRIEKLQ